MNPKPLYLFVFADALGWRIAEHYSVLSAELIKRQRCDTLFGYSSTCDPTILTGVDPHEHGHFSFFVKANNASPFRHFDKLSFLPQKVAGHHRIRSRLSRYVARHQGFTGYFQLYSVPFSRLPYLDYTEKNDIYEPGGILGGQSTIFEKWRSSAKPWLRSDWRRGDDANFAQAKAAVGKEEVELLYLFTAGLDATMHRHGPWSNEAAAAMRTFEIRLTELIELAKRHYREVRVTVFSDHGMAEVTRCSDLRMRFERQNWRYGKDYVAVWDSTMARFWFENQRFEAEIKEWLALQEDGAVLDDDTLRRWGCFFPGKKYGELFYLLPEGSLFVPSFMNLNEVAGMHGYSPEAPDSAAACLSNWETPPVNRLRDIYPVMASAAFSET